MLRIRCFTPDQVARALQISRPTLLRILVQYDVRVLPLPGKMRFRIPESELERLIKQLPVFAELRIKGKMVTKYRKKRAAWNTVENLTQKDAA